MIDNIPIVVHALIRHELMSLSIDDITAKVSEIVN